MTERERLTREEIEILRRSVAATGQLPRDQVERVLREITTLLDERDQIAGLIVLLAPSWRDLRGVLNEIHRAVVPRRASNDRRD